MPNHDIVVIGTSAGGVETLTRLMPDLPADLPAAIFIVLHLPTNATSALPNILRRYTKLPVLHPSNGEPIKPGHIYVAPPDQHLIVRYGHIHLTRGPKENGHRPAIDPLFRTAARSYGQRVIGVVLSGTLDDGTAGLLAIKMRGGLAVVQDPDDALYSGMPLNAIENAGVDHIVPLSQLGVLMTRLVHEPVDESLETPVTDNLDYESEIAEIDMEAIEEEKPGSPSEFACPDCGGILWELQDGKLVRYRCRTGHAYSPESLLAQQSEAVEEALWAALRALEERASLSERMARRADERNQPTVARKFKEQVTDAHKSAALIRNVLLRGTGTIPKHEDTEDR